MNALLYNEDAHLCEGGERDMCCVMNGSGDEGVDDCYFVANCVILEHLVSLWVSSSLWLHEMREQLRPFLTWCLLG